MGQREKSFTVEWTTRALERLQEIYDYLYPVAGERIAGKIAGKLSLKTRILARFPKMGPCELSLENEPEEYRYLVCGNYKIIYYIDADTVYIATVFDCRQNPEAMDIEIKK